ncbi:YetF domain-containing protein [Xylophilus sp. GOD-11R]|uniref:YetF domain-containing protein n=1 Tax=Xylophilus sp. GOD-11R TaxID=3089814 RepID=UPI00399B8467
MRSTLMHRFPLRHQRVHGVRNLFQVKAAYLEANGEISVLKEASSNRIQAACAIARRLCR